MVDSSVDPTHRGHLLAAIADPASLYHGIVVKAVVISVLAGSNRNIHRHRTSR